MSTPISVLRDAIAKSGALRMYALAHDHFSEEEQTMAGEGRIAEAEGAHQFALLALRAYRAEIDDPEPPERTYIMCSKPRCPVCG